MQEAEREKAKLEFEKRQEEEKVKNDQLMKELEE